MPSLRVVADLLGDPKAVLALGRHGREGLHRYAICRMLSLPSSSVQALYSDLERNQRFGAAIREASSTAKRPLGGFVRPWDLYVVCRSLKPRVVVETGVASGLSSAFILQALEDNGAGRLYSIDLPNADDAALLGTVLTKLPSGQAPGWVVPPWLRSRWDLRIGRSRDLLPPLLAELGAVEIFLHDSEHSFENMMFEFEESWPRIVPGGYLLADDVNLPAARGAFQAFTKKVGRTPEEIFAGFGAIKKR